MSKNVAIFVAEVKRQVASLKKYPLEFVGNLVGFSVIIIAIMVGLYSISGGMDFKSLALFPILLATLGTAYQSYRDDVEFGVFDQIYNSGTNLFTLYLCRAMISVMFSLLPTAILFCVSPIMTVGTFNIIGIILALLYVSIIGTSLGMMYLALSFLFRKLSIILNASYVLFLLFTFLEPTHAIFHIIPFISVDTLLSSSFSVQIAIVIGISICFWGGMSYILVKWCYAKAQRRGTLGLF